MKRVVSLIWKTVKSSIYGSDVEILPKNGSRVPKVQGGERDIYRSRNSIVSMDVKGSVAFV